MYAILSFDPVIVHPTPVPVFGLVEQIQNKVVMHLREDKVTFRVVDFHTPSWLLTPVSS